MDDLENNELPANDTIPRNDSAEPASHSVEASEEESSATEKSENERSARTEKKESQNESLRILEVLIFASDEILTTDRLKAILPGQPDVRKIRSMVDTINIQLQKERHPFEIIEAAGGFQFRTVSYYYPWVSQLFKEKSAKKLSIQSLECLAIIAYRQPITKAEIEAIRGVMSDGAMKTLLEKRLVTITGRSEKAGRPLLYATTKDFLSYFGLNKIVDLPDIHDFEALAKEKLGDLTESELTSITETAQIPVEPEMLEEVSALPEQMTEEPSAPEQKSLAADTGPLQE